MYKKQALAFNGEFVFVCMCTYLHDITAYITNMYSTGRCSIMVFFWVKTFKSRAQLRQFRVNPIILLQQLHTYTTLYIPHVW